MQFLSVFLNVTKVTDFRWRNASFSKLKYCVTLFIYFLDFLYVRYNCAKFHHCRICVTDFREKGLFCSLRIREQSQKGWIRLTIKDVNKDMKNKNKFVEILFWDFLTIEQISLSPEVKRSVIISNKLL